MIHLRHCMNIMHLPLPPKPSSLLSVQPQLSLCPRLELLPVSSDAPGPPAEANSLRVEDALITLFLVIAPLSFSSIVSILS